MKREAKVPRIVQKKLDEAGYTVLSAKQTKHIHAEVRTPSGIVVNVVMCCSPRDWHYEANYVLQKIRRAERAKQGA